MAHGKCPKCDQTVGHANLDAITIDREYQGYTVLCPSCGTILGTAIDPLTQKRADDLLTSLKNEIVRELKALRK
jgi:transcription elongation factor Elf1